jgi:hypothetical protein
MRNNICFILIRLIINSPYNKRSILYLYLVISDRKFIVKMDKPTFDIYSTDLLKEKPIYNGNSLNNISISNIYGLLFYN